MQLYTYYQLLWHMGSWSYWVIIYVIRCEPGHKKGSHNDLPLFRPCHHNAAGLAWAEAAGGVTEGFWLLNHRTVLLIKAIQNIHICICIYIYIFNKSKKHSKYLSEYASFSPQKKTTKKSALRA